MQTVKLNSPGEQVPQDPENSLAAPTVPQTSTQELANGPARDDQTIAKANEAIAIKPKRGKLTLLSRRIFNALLFHAQQQGVDQPVYTIMLSELIDDARFNSNNTELLKSHLRDMQATTIEWSSSIGKGQRWSSRSLLGKVDIDSPGRGAPCTITWSYDDDIREKLVKPAHYTRVLLEISSQMRSYAAAVLYELGARYITSPSRLTMREDVVWWASVLTGRSDITTVDYRILHRDTIKKALAEIDALNEDFRLEVIEHRRGRKVEELQFRVVPKVQASLQHLKDGTKNVFDLELVERVVALGMKRPEAQDLYAMTDEGVLRAAVEHVEQRQKSTSLPPLQSSMAYFRDALKKQYAGGPTDDDKPAATAPRQLSLPEKLQKLRDEWQAERLVIARARFADFSQEDRNSYITRFETERLNDLASPIAKAWRRDGVESRIAGSSFFKWLATVLWPTEVTDTELLEFAMSRER